MAYQKTEWKDQQVENPRTYSVRQNLDNTITLLDAFGEITEIGTPVNAENMNKIEQGIADAQLTSNLEQSLSQATDKYPCSKAVQDAVNARQLTSNLSQTLDSSTSKYPSNKAVQDALNAKANLASPAFSGTPTAPTQASTDSSTRLATTAFVNNFFNTAGKVSGKCIPNYGAAVATTAKDFTAPFDCEYFVWIRVEDATYAFYCYYTTSGSTEKTIISNIDYNGSYYYSYLPICKVMGKGDRIRFTGNSFSISGVYAPLKGA